MMRSLFSGVSGLKNHQTRMDVIGNNISNVNTTGFKSSRVMFSDMLSQTLTGPSAPNGNMGGINAKQIGLGSSVSSISMLFTDGSVQSTGKNTDLCLSSDNGLFILGTGNTDEKLYTRNGAFEFDAAGNYVQSGNGYYVQGWMADETGSIDTGAKAGIINVPSGKGMQSVASKAANYTLNLNSETPIIDKITQTHTLKYDPIAETRVYNTAADGNATAGASTDRKIMRTVQLVLRDKDNPKSIDNPNGVADITVAATEADGIIRLGDYYEYNAVGKTVVDIQEQTTYTGFNSDSFPSIPVVDHPQASTVSTTTLSTATELELELTMANGTTRTVLVDSGTFKVGDNYPDNSSSTVISKITAKSTTKVPTTTTTKNVGSGVAGVASEKSNTVTIYHPNEFAPNTIATAPVPNKVRTEMGTVQRSLNLTLQDATGATSTVTIPNTDTSGTVFMKGGYYPNAAGTKCIITQIDQTSVFTSWDGNSNSTVGPISVEEAVAGRFDVPTAVTLELTLTNQNTGEVTIVQAKAEDGELNLNDHYPNAESATTITGISETSTPLVDPNTGTPVDRAAVLPDSVPPQSSVSLVMSNGDIVTPNSGTYELNKSLPIVTTLTVYDTLGASHDVAVYFKLTDATTNTWTVSTTLTDDLQVIKEADGTLTTVEMPEVKLVFNDNGRFDSGAGMATLTLMNGSSSPQEVSVDFTKMTQYANETTVAGKADGNAAGTLKTITIDTNGIITGTYTNGMRRAEAQVALQRFTNPAGLMKVGDSIYQDSNNAGKSGEPSTVAALGAKLTPAALEMSNVDIANEFTDMIVTQRGFQANSKIITVSDEMLDLLMNMKR